MLVNLLLGTEQFTAAENMKKKKKIQYLFSICGG